MLASDCFFFFGPTNCPKPEDSSFILRNDKEKLQIFIFKKLEPAKRLTFIDC